MTVELELPPGLSAAEARRYLRHTVLPEVGVAGQERLKAARVLVVGAGGLGSPVGLYLAAAGVGTLALVDFDRVDETNLQRQILYGQSDVGRLKLDAAVERLRDVNPHINVEPVAERFQASNALDLVRSFDVVVDGTDNFPTRYLVNDACVLERKPLVYGSIFRFEGQVSLFWGGHGPCYRCLFPEPPPPGMVPSCAEGGVLGVLPGVIGALQANEAIKLIVGIGESLLGRLVLFDALRLKFRELALTKDPECPLCSDRPTQQGLVEYDDHCAPAAAEDDGNLTVAALKKLLDAGAELTLLDVRNPVEYQVCRLAGSKLLPMPELPARFGELDTEEQIVVYCHTGIRSAHAVAFLKRQGYHRARNLLGGIHAWSLEIDPTVPRY